MLSACSENEPVPEPEPVPTEVGRTLLVYMVARNSLGSWDFDQDDIAEMKIASKNGAFGKNRLILFHSQYGAAPEIKEVVAGEVKVLKTYSSDFSSVDAQNMRKVIADVKSLAPARNYGIVLWSHADGWMQTGVQAETGKKRAFGDDAGKSMNVTTLAGALKGQGFDFVYFDCCFMGGVEVAWQLRDVAQVIAASPSELPSPGMPYDLTLSYLMADEADVAGAAAATFASYDALTGNARTCTMTVVDTSRLPALAEKVRVLYALHPQLDSTADVQQFAGVGSSSFHNRYFDLGDYIRHLADADAGCAAAAADAAEALEACVTYKASTPFLWEHDAYNSIRYEVKINNYSGLSTFIMSSASMSAVKGYDELDWYRDVASALF